MKIEAISFFLTLNLYLTHTGGGCESLPVGQFLNLFSHDGARQKAYGMHG
jgi:hypothetical protein